MPTAGLGDDDLEVGAEPEATLADLEESGRSQPPSDGPS